METLEKPLIASIDKIEANADRVQQLSAEVEELLSTPALAPQTPPRIFLAFLMGMSLGLSLGAGVVVIAGLIFLH